MVRTICYGIEDKWNTRQEALDYFEAGIVCTEGSERDRYIKVWSELMDGSNLATDTEWAVVCAEDMTVLSTFDSLEDAECELAWYEAQAVASGSFKDGLYKVIEW